MERGELSRPPVPQQLPSLCPAHSLPAMTAYLAEVKETVGLSWYLDSARMHEFFAWDTLPGDSDQHPRVAAEHRLPSVRRYIPSHRSPCAPRGKREGIEYHIREQVSEWIAVYRPRQEDHGTDGVNRSQPRGHKGVSPSLLRACRIGSKGGSRRWGRREPSRVITMYGVHA